LAVEKIGQQGIRSKRGVFLVNGSAFMAARCTGTHGKRDYQYMHPWAFTVGTIYQMIIHALSKSCVDHKLKILATFEWN
jgi:hypothetical protein